MRLNVGCGPHYAEGWTNIDLYREDEIRDGRRVDVVCSVLNLPFPDSSCSHVYAGHVLEHLSLGDETPRALGEIRRVLALDGELMVVGPDIARAEAGWPSMISAILPGEHDEDLPPGIPHKWAPTGESTVALCKQVFPLAAEIPIASIGAPWPVVDRVGWQLAVHCPVSS